MRLIQQDDDEFLPSPHETLRELARRRADGDKTPITYKESVALWNAKKLLDALPDAVKDLERMDIRLSTELELEVQTTPYLRSVLGFE